MTKFEVRNNMAYASQMQFEVLRRALWAQQAQPQTVFDMRILGESSARSKDDYLPQPGCESEDV